MVAIAAMLMNGGLLEAVQSCNNLSPFTLLGLSIMYGKPTKIRQILVTPKGKYFAANVYQWSGSNGFEYECSTHVTSQNASAQLEPRDSQAAPVAVTSASLSSQADVNGDGIPDIVDALRSPEIAVYLGNGDGTFQTAVQYPVGATPSNLAVADVNGDRIPDIVVTDFDPPSSNYVSILLGNGDGTFQAATNLSVGQYPASVAIGDFNGDGKADLAVAASDALYLMLGSGGGNFQMTASILPSNGLSVVAADLNSDGKLDLALSNQPASGPVTLVTLLGNGDGTFQSPLSSDAGPGIADFLGVADFNGDGKPDIAISGEYTGTLTVRTGKGDGTFGPDTVYLAGGAQVSTSFDMTDVNGDGNLDFVVSDSTSGVVAQNIYGNGDGTFQAPPYYPTPGAANGTVVSSLAAADFNGDGKQDVFTSDGSLWLGNGSGAFELAASAPGVGAVSFAVAGDFNGDGVPDLATTSGVALGNGNGTFRSALPYPGGIIANYIVTGDFNRDGKLDLALAPYNPSDVLGLPGAANISVLLGNGDGTFQQAAAPALSNARPFALAAGDFNGDGKPDLAVVNYGVFQGTTVDAGGVSILLGNGDGTFMVGPQIAAGNNPAHVAAADINGDGKLDLVVATTTNGTNGALAVFLGNGDGSFNPQPLIATAPNIVQWITILDLNGDGKPDILECENNADIGFFAGNGDGTFQAEIPFPAGPNPLQVATADFNGDGEPDLAVADNNSYGGGGGWVALLNASGSATAAMPAISANGSAATADITALSPASIAALYGSNLATGTAQPTGSSLPTTLAGTSVTITDASGKQQLAPLFYVSPIQINYLLPSGTALGTAQITVTNANGKAGSTAATVSNIAPGVFALNSAGLAAAIELIVGASGSQTFGNVYQVNASNDVIPLPINLSAGQIYLEVYGTGFRNAANVTATVGGANIPVVFAGAQSTDFGLDQINLGPLPLSLAGSGQVNLVLTADGQAANTVNVTIQ